MIQVIISHPRPRKEGEKQARIVFGYTEEEFGTWIQSMEDDSFFSGHYFDRNSKGAREARLDFCRRIKEA